MRPGPGWRRHGDRPGLSGQPMTTAAWHWWPDSVESGRNLGIVRTWHKKSAIGESHPGVPEAFVNRRPLCHPCRPASHPDGDHPCPLQALSSRRRLQTGDRHHVPVPRNGIFLRRGHAGCGPVVVRCGAPTARMPPDDMHAKQFDVGGWLTAQGFEKIAGRGRTTVGGRYTRGSHTLEVGFRSGQGDVVADICGHCVWIETKGRHSSGCLCRTIRAWERWGCWGQMGLVMRSCRAQPRASRFMLLQKIFKRFRLCRYLHQNRPKVVDATLGCLPADVLNATMGGICACWFWNNRKYRIP